MDIFSLGCIMNDLFQEGDHPLFTYETVQKFGKGEFSPLSTINLIKVEYIKEIVINIVIQRKFINISDVFDGVFGHIFLKAYRFTHSISCVLNLQFSKNNTDFMIFFLNSI